MSLFGEVLNGLPTLRASNKQDQYLEKHRNNMNDLKKVQIMTNGLSNWLQVRIASFSFVVVIAGLCLAVSYLE